MALMIIFTSLFIRTNLLLNSRPGPPFKRPFQVGHRCRRLIVNLEARNVKLQAQKLHLTAKEYQMLALLALRTGSTLTKETFLNHLYGGSDGGPEAKIIDVFICRPRKKLANASGGLDYIETIWGRGYALESQPSKRSQADASEVSRSGGYAVAQPHHRHGTKTSDAVRLTTGPRRIFTPSTPQSPFARVSCSPSALRACPPSLSVARDLPAPAMAIGLKFPPLHQATS